MNDEFKVGDVVVLVSSLGWDRKPVGSRLVVVDPCDHHLLHDKISITLVNKYKQDFKLEEEKNMSYIIATKDKHTGFFSMSTQPRIHTSKASADTEAKRLAGQHTDKKFIVLKVTTVFAAVDVTKVDL